MMKKVVLIIVILFGCFSLAQQTREEKIRQLKKREDVKVIEVKKDLLRIEYTCGKVLYKNISDYKYPESSAQYPAYSPTFDSTIIDLTTIDTTLYYQKYRFFGEVNVGSPQTAPPLVGDVNNNKLAEIYGQRKEYTASDVSNYIVIMEMNAMGDFDSVYSYDSTVIAKSICDVDKDKKYEVRLMRNHIDSVDTNTYTGWKQYLFYAQETDTSLATNLSIIFEPWHYNNSQQNNNQFGDWDGDELTDQIFIRDCCPPSIYNYEYNTGINNFDSVYQFDFSMLDLFYGGFTIGDFDQDMKTEFFAGSIHGKVLCIENNGNNSYQLTWQGMVETYNAYQLAQTNDIDQNGKKEIWIGGDAFYPGIGPMTRITIFEANGDNNYQIAGRIDLIGIFSLYAQNYQAVDVDKDGIEEMMVCIEETVLILKFNGSPNHQTYDLFYFKQNDLMLAGRSSVYYGATMYDVTNDGKKDIIIHLDEYVESLGWRLLTFIYRADFTSGIENPDQFPKEFHLYPIFPNPFNSSAKIKFDIPEYSEASIKVYNILGKKISILLEKELSPGNYTINWDAKDADGRLLPSGVYLIRLSTADYAYSIKAVLLK